MTFITLFIKQRFYNSPNVRYHPTTHTNVKVLRGTTAAPATAAAVASGSTAAATAAGPSAKDQATGKSNLEDLSIVFNLLVSIIDHMISSLPNGSSPTSHAGRNGKSNGTKAKFTLSAATMKQLQILRQPTDWVGPVFCNTVRPLLLVQGKWSYQVEIAWRLLFRHLVRKNRTFDDDSDEE